jgi:hypothetical protein
MNSAPELLTIEPDDHHAQHVGTLSDGRQFFLTTPFEPAIGDNPGCEYIALYLFDKSGAVVEAKVGRIGPRSNTTAHTRQSLLNQWLLDLGAITLERIEIQPFAIERFGITFGLVAREPDDEDDSWTVEAQPGNYMAFFEPWDSGEYDT